MVLGVVNEGLYVVGAGGVGVLVVFIIGLATVSITSSSKTTG